MKNKKRLFIFLLVCLSFFLLCFYIKDSDYYWHIKAGEKMLEEGILTKDIFSWYMSGNYWMSHEWLFEVTIAFLRNIFGSLHMIIYPFICILSLLSILFFSNKESFYKNTLFSLGWITLFIFIITGFVQVRPHMISFCFVGITMYLLFDLYKNNDSKNIWFLPLLGILWSNFHGGSSSLIYIFCFIFFICGLFKFKFSKIESSRINKKVLNTYLIVGILCIISLCFNPHGFKMVMYPYINLGDTLMISNISEWQPTVLSKSSHYAYFIVVIVIGSIFLLSKKKIKFLDLVLFGVCVFLGLKSIRFWPYTYIIMSFVVFDYIPERKDDKGTGIIMLVLGCLFLLPFIFSYGDIVSRVESSNLNEKMISTIKKESPKRLYNMYDYGGELIYNDIDVFIDGRADLYSGYNYEDYLNISYLEKDYVKLINKYKFDYFLVNEKYPIYTYLKYNDDYELVYKYKKIYLYKEKRT